MMKRSRTYIGFAFLGLGVAAALFGYLEATDYAKQGPVFIGAAVALCPPCLLTVAFMTRSRTR